MKERGGAVVSDRPHPLVIRPVLRNSPSRASRARSSDSARTVSVGLPADKRSLIGLTPQLRPAPSCLCSPANALANTSVTHNPNQNPRKLA